MTALGPDARPALVSGMRLQWEPAQEAHVLLYPEGMVRLNGSAAAILTHCDGLLTVTQIVAQLEQAYAASGLTDEVLAFVAFAVQRRWLTVDS
jgi:pyrroloquinoline quinone biosynthesis protein D